MNITAFIRTKKDTASIRFRVTDGRSMILYATSSIEIQSDWWNPKKETLKSSIAISPSTRADVVGRINVIKSDITTAYEADKDIDGIVTSEWLSAIVNGKVHKRAAATDFMQLFKDFYMEKEMSILRRNGYKVLLGKLQRFQIIERKHLQIDSLNQKTLLEIERFIRKEPELVKLYPVVYLDMVVKNRGTNYISDNMKRIKAFVNHCRTCGIITNNPFAGYIIQKEVYANPIALTADEVEIIYQFSGLPKFLQKVRDLFVLHCYIGCRVGDYVQLKPENIDDDTLVYCPAKTIRSNASEVRVPLTERSLEIIERYGYPKGQLMPFININGSNGYNKSIKALLCFIGLDRKIMTLDSVTGRTEFKPLYEAATSHTARKTFISCVLNSTQSDTITQSLTGHKDTKSFRRYPLVQDGTLKNVIDNAFSVSKKIPS